MSRSSFISEEELRQNLEQILPDIRIEECPVKLGLISMDLDNGEEVLFVRGSVIESVLASCAIPGVFPPLTYRDRQLVDGTWVNPIPAKTARLLGADYVIGVDVTPKMSNDVRATNGWNISLKASEATRVALRSYCLTEADTYVSIDLMNIHWADFLQLHKCIEEGERAARSVIPTIKKKLFWRKFTPKLFLSEKYAEVH